MNKKYILPVAAASLLMVSCADEFNPAYTSVEIPVDLAKIEELSGFAPLKENINRANHPGFKLGAALTASEFNKQLVVYNVGVTNFDEVVAGNAMKYASCVDNKGNMNFSTVTEFVNKADEAGISVYGHTLVWHSQQQPKYLNGLIADKPMPVGPNATPTITYIIDRDFEDASQKIGGWGNNSTQEVKDGVLIFSNPSAVEFWAAQAAIDMTTAFENGKKYTLKMKVKSDASGLLRVGFQNPDGYKGCGDFAPIELTEDWKDVALECTITGENALRFIFSFGDVAGNIYIDDLKLYAGSIGDEEAAAPSGPTREVIIERDFSDASQKIGGWGNNSTQEVKDGMLIFSNPSAVEFWAAQAAVDMTTAFEEGETYTLMMKVKSNATGSLRVGFQNPDGYKGCGDFAPIPLSADWQEVCQECKITGENALRFIFSFGDIAGDIMIDDLLLYKGKMPEYETTMYVDRDFSEDSQKIGGWGNNSTQVVEDGVLVLTNPSVTDPWAAQIAVDFNDPIPNGTVTTMEIKAKASAEMQLAVGFQNPDGYAGQGDFPKLDLTTSWQTFKVDCTVNGDGAKRFIFSYGQHAGNVYIDDLKLYSRKMKEVGGGAAPSVEVEKTFTEKKPTLVVTSSDLIEFAWDTQFWIKTNDEFADGDSYEVSMDVRADLPAKASTQVHGEPGDYHFYVGIGDVNFTPDWETYKNSGTLQTDGKGGRTIAFNLNEFAKANKYYFRNISLKINGIEQITNGNLASNDNSAFFSKESKGAVNPTIFNTEILPSITYTKMVASNTIPLTKEEKDSILSIQLDKWIAGMMDACGGKVKAWDLANELISGGAERVDGRYALQHGEEGDDQNFFWQDYLGDEKVVQFAVASARQHYAESMEEQGGDDGQLKLFINDYNLESDWDDNAKLKSLIEWIKVWESDGVTKIDGIGSQMHISYYEDPETLESKKAAIKKSFELMAATGKLVRISELDMGYVKSGKEATLAEMYSPEQVKAGYPMEKAMADYYQWIIETYFEVVPKDQQYGITQWCLTDSEAGSGWRADTPTGIWDSNWNRKYVYRGWVNALQK